MVVQGDKQMATTKTTKKNAWKPWHGFAIEIGPDTDLGGDAILILEYQAGGYEPIAGVSTINEAQELAADRMRRDYGKMPGDTFKVWARGAEGRFLTVPVVIDGQRK
jgi:hypothetical protein